MADNKLTFVEHLEELRGRIIKILAFLIIGSIVCYYYLDVILPFVMKPVGTLQILAPQEAFLVRIKLAFCGGGFLASPAILWQVWGFVSSALKPNEKKYVLLFGPLSFLFFVAGSAFGFLIIMPIGIKFLLGYVGDSIVPGITLSNYISFAGAFTLAFGAVFELPLVSLFLTKIGLVTPKLLSSKRRHAIVGMFIAAAALTPPDPVSQLLMAAPLILLYELGIIFSKMVYKAPC